MPDFMDFLDKKNAKLTNFITSISITNQKKFYHHH